MNDDNDELLILSNHGDAAALMIAACDDREAMAATIKTMTFADAAELLLSAVEVGGTLVRLGDQHPSTTPRALLRAVVDGCRGGVE